MEPMDAKIKQSNATEDPIGVSMEPLNIKIWKPMDVKMKPENFIMEPEDVQMKPMDVKI